jgi:hypothetical protein
LSTGSSLRLLILILILVTAVPNGRLVLLDAGNLGVNRHVSVELKRCVVPYEFDSSNGKVLRVVWNASGAGQCGRHLCVVKERRPGFLRRIDHPPFLPLTGFIAVPEAVSGLEPVWRDRRIKNQFAYFGGRPPRGQIVVGFARPIVD